MRIVLGIDAAWTDQQPSGVALACNAGDGWTLAAAEPSYEHFLALAAGTTHDAAPTGSIVSALDLVEAVKKLAGRAPDLIAIDMPLARTPITGRRGADTAISRAYGAKWCAAHSPSQVRPGPLSDRLRSEFEGLGYQLCIEALATPGLIEVYPHPALVELADEPKRLPYKVGKIRSYWPNQTPKQRLRALRAEWDSIAPVLEAYLKGAELRIENFPSHKLKELKNHEDVLDAIVCCVSGIRALDGAAKSYSLDDDSAIWVPTADKVLQADTLLPKSPYSARTEMRGELFADHLAEGKYPELTGRSDSEHIKTEGQSRCREPDPKS